MKTEQCIVNLALLGGWLPDDTGVVRLWINPDLPPVPRKRRWQHDLPPYFDSLDAVLDLRRRLTPEQKKKCIHELTVICDRDYGGEVDPSDVLDPVEMSSMFLDCTAAQHAEAILRATGNGKETKV